jgi:hypothetical protein
MTILSSFGLAREARYALTNGYLVPDWRRDLYYRLFGRS